MKQPCIQCELLPRAGDLGLCVLCLEVWNMLCEKRL